MTALPGSPAVTGLTAEKHAATQNACRLCTPLGASLAFKGIERTVPLLHGSQGCATYIRRYLISHFREPVDIASSSFSEATAVFGGEQNLKRAIENVLSQYRPAVVGIATTCLSETIGDDVSLFLAGFRRGRPELPPLVHVSTPAYRGSHVDGYRDAVTAVLKTLAEPGPRGDEVALIPSMVSPADLRYLRGLGGRVGVRLVLLPDHADTLDGPFWPEYQVLPPGGTPLSEVRALGGARACLQLGRSLDQGDSPGRYLAEAFGVQSTALELPVGVVATDRFLEALEGLGGSRPEELTAERGRVLDAYADAHKYLFGCRVALYGEPDLVTALAGFACEVGLEPVVCATGSRGHQLGDRLRAVAPTLPASCRVLEDADFADIESAVERERPHLLLGNSKGFKTARRLCLPLIRVGFPIHDRFGSQRVRMLGYDGTLELLDRVVNVILERRQSESRVGYTYF